MSVKPADDCLFQIFSEFRPHHLVLLGLVCKQWQNVAYHDSLWKKFVKIFDENFWKANIDVKALGLEFDGIEPMDFSEAIRIAAPFFVRLVRKGYSIEGGPSVTILTVPKNLSIPRLLQIGSKQKNEDAFFKRFNLESALPKFERCESKAYRVIMTNQVLAQSRKWNRLLQNPLLEEIDCASPTVLQMTTLAYLGRLIAKESSPLLCETRTFYRCFEPDYPYPYIIGIFKEGVRIKEYLGNEQEVGVAAVWRFEKSLFEKISALLWDFWDKL